MEFGSISLVVNDPEVALRTYLKVYGTNNVEQVIKLKGLNDNVDVVDGYVLKTKPVNLEILKPRDPSSKMGEQLKKNGEGIHHISLHLGQDDFESTYLRFKEQGLKVSDKITYIGKLSEAVFWLLGEGPQGVPIKLATKCYHGLKLWTDTVYIDTPQKFEQIKITEQFIMPRVNLGTIMVTVKDWAHQPRGRKAARTIE